MKKTDWFFPFKVMMVIGLLIGVAAVFVVSVLTDVKLLKNKKYE